MRSENEYDSNENNVIDNINPTATHRFGESNRSTVDLDISYKQKNNNDTSLKVQSRSDRKKSPVNKYGNPITHYIYVKYVDANKPNTFKETINSCVTKHWKLAINSESNSLNKKKKFTFFLAEESVVIHADNVSKTRPQTIVRFATIYANIQTPHHISLI